jgi:hypothetical protein
MNRVKEEPDAALTCQREKKPWFIKAVSAAAIERNIKDARSAEIAGPAYAKLLPR